MRGNLFAGDNYPIIAFLQYRLRRDESQTASVASYRFLRNALARQPIPKRTAPSRVGGRRVLSGAERLFVRAHEFFHELREGFHTLDGAGVVNGGAATADRAMSLETEHALLFGFTDEFLLEFLAR